MKIHIALDRTHALDFLDSSTSRRARGASDDAGCEEFVRDGFGKGRPCGQQDHQPQHIGDLAHGESSSARTS